MEGKYVWTEEKTLEEETLRCADISNKNVGGVCMGFLNAPKNVFGQKQLLRTFHCANNNQNYPAERRNKQLERGWSATR